MAQDFGIMSELYSILRRTIKQTHSMFSLFINTCLSILSIAGDAEAKTQTLVICNLDSKTGKLYIGWYKTEGDYNKKLNAVFSKIEPVTGSKEQRIHFAAVPTGRYAIAVFLDENGNGKIDTNILGIPKEKYGFSNNRFPLTRAASFEEAAVSVEDREEVISIRLK